jgi:adenosylhomocysteine nucleosidase
MWVIDEHTAVDRPLAVICALEGELIHLNAALGPGREEWHAGRSVWRTTMEEAPVILACCGIGMLSAAAVTEAVIGRYAPGAVLNYGCAGAHRADLLPGDLVIGSRTIAYDSVTMNPDGTEGNVRMYYLRAGVQHRVPHLSAAPHLVALANHAAREWEGQYDAWPLTAGWPSSVPHRRPRVFVGTVA